VGYDEKGEFKINEPSRSDFREIIGLTDSRLELVSGCHPNLNPGRFEVGNRLWDTVLKPIFDRGSTKQPEVAFDLFRDSRDLLLAVFQRDGRLVVSYAPFVVLVLCRKGLENYSQITVRKNHIRGMTLYASVSVLKPSFAKESKCSSVIILRSSPPGLSLS
jgi:hypothetical protein